MVHVHLCATVHDQFASLRQPGVDVVHGASFRPPAASVDASSIDDRTTSSYWGGVETADLPVEDPSLEELGLAYRD